MRVDSHHHLWQYDPIAYDWISDEMAVLKKDFSAELLKKELDRNKIDYCIAVQARQSDAETLYLLEQADEHPFIAGVVGWTDLLAEDIEERLKAYKKYPKLKGFRHILQAEEPDFLYKYEFRRGIAALQKFDFTYDLLILPNQLPEAIDLVENFPDTRFVIDHIAKPKIRQHELSIWAGLMREIARHRNVHCKLSGIVTEANWENWTPEQITPYLDAVFEVFDTTRLMFGSDWPVCLLAGTYDKVKTLIEQYFQDLYIDQEEIEAIFGGNAKSFYKIQG